MKRVIGFSQARASSGCRRLMLVLIPRQRPGRAMYPLAPLQAKLWQGREEARRGEPAPASLEEALAIAEPGQELLDLSHSVLAGLGLAVKAAIRALRQLPVLSDRPLIGGAVRLRRQDLES